MKTGVKVLDAMTRKPIIVTPKANVMKCAQTMAKEGVGSVLVKEGKELRGIVTEKDMLKKVVAKGLHGKNLSVEEIMTRKMVTIAPDEDLYDAWMKMNDEEVRRLPVLHKGELIGLLTMNDVLKIEPQLFDYMVEKLEVKHKPVLQGLKHGRCEQCGDQARLVRVGDSLLCSMCRSS